MTKDRFSILFVCLGNICRSPLAHGIFEHLIEEQGIEDRFCVDSCGTGAWCVGEPPHEETIRIAAKHGISIEGQRARRTQKSDFSEFDLIVAMDRSNFYDLKDMAGSEQAKIVHLREYDTEGSSLDVPDPFQGSSQAFEDVYQIVYRSCEKLLADLSTWSRPSL